MIFKINLGFIDMTVLIISCYFDSVNIDLMQTEINILVIKLGKTRVSAPQRQLFLKILYNYKERNNKLFVFGSKYNYKLGYMS